MKRGRKFSYGVMQHMMLLHIWLKQESFRSQWPVCFNESLFNGMDLVHFLVYLRRNLIRLSQGALPNVRVKSCWFWFLLVCFINSTFYLYLKACS